VYEEFSSQISALLVEYCVRLSGLNLTDLGRGFVFSKVRVMSSVFGTALFVCISLGLRRVGTLMDWFVFAAG